MASGLNRSFRPQHLSLRLGNSAVRCCVFFTASLFLLPQPTAFAAQNLAPSTSAVSASLLAQARQHPQTLIRSVVLAELAQNSGHRPLLRYRLHKVTVHLDTTKEIIETRDGDVACLIAASGKPLTAAARNAELTRLQQLRNHPALEAHRHRREQADTERFNQVLRALPDAFLFTFVDEVPTAEGPALRFTFQPNPRYAPTSFETRALRALRGQLWINARQQRVQFFHALQFEPISFGWGILGRLDKNGSIELIQSQVAPRVWDFTHLQLSFTGRALLKSLQVQVNETAADYSRIDPSLTYQQAVDLLLRDDCGTTQ